MVELEPTRAEAWRVLGNALVEADRSQEAAHAYAKHLESGGGDLQSLEGMACGGDDQLPTAEKALCEWLSARPTDVTALHFLGSVLHVGIFPRAHGMGLAGSGPHIRHWQAAFWIHADRTDSRQPFACGGNDRIEIVGLCCEMRPQQCSSK